MADTAPQPLPPEAPPEELATTQLTPEELAAAKQRSAESAERPTAVIIPSPKARGSGGLPFDPAYAGKITPGPTPGTVTTELTPEEEARAGGLVASAEARKAAAKDIATPNERVSWATQIFGDASGDALNNLDSLQKMMRMSVGDFRKSMSGFNEKDSELMLTQSQIIDREADIELHKAELNDAVLQQRDRTLAVEMQARDERRRSIETEANKKNQVIAQIIQDTRNEAIDPNRYIKNPDGSTRYGKVAALAIAVALGELGTAFGGGPNNALAIVNNAIDRDIEAQRSAISGKRETLEQEKYFYGDLLNRLGDAEQADRAFKISHYEKFQTELDKVAASTRSEDVMIKVQRAKLAIEGEKNKHTAAFAERNFDLASKEIGLGLNIGQAKLQAQQAKGLSAAQLSDIRQQQSLQKAGLGGTPINEKALGQAIGIKSQRTAVSSAIDELIRMRGKTGPGKEDTGIGAEFLERFDVDRAKALAADIKGALKGTEYESLTERIPDDPTRIGFVLHNLEEFKRDYEKRTDNDLSDRGVHLLGGEQKLVRGGAKENP